MRAVILLGIAFGLTAGFAGTSSAVEQCDASGQPIVSQAVRIADAVNIALRNNPSIASRRALLAAAAARVGMARAMTRPQISTTTLGSLGNMPMVFSGPDTVQPQNFSLTPDKPRLDQ